MHVLARLRRDEAGATAVEYAIMVALIAVVIAATVALFGVTVRDLFIVPAEVFNRG